MEVKALPPNHGGNGGTFRALVDGLTAEYAMLLGENERLRAVIARSGNLQQVDCLERSRSSDDHPFGVAEKRLLSEVELEELIRREEGMSLHSVPPSPDICAQPPQPPEGHFPTCPPPGNPPQCCSSRVSSRVGGNSRAASRQSKCSHLVTRPGALLWARLRDHFRRGEVHRDNPKLSQVSRSPSEGGLEISDVWKKSGPNKKAKPGRFMPEGRDSPSTVESGENPADSQQSGLNRATSLKRQLKHVWHHDEDRPRGTSGYRFLQLLIVKPDDKRHLAWDLLSLCMLAYDILGTPMDVFEPAETSFGRAMELTTLVFWTVDIVVAFFSGYHTVKSIEMRPGRIACHYLKTWFILDFGIIMLEWLSVGEASILRIGKFARGFRVIRLLRILKVQIIFDQLNDFIRSETTMMVFQIGRLVMFILVINHFVACGWWAVGTHVEHQIHWTDRVKQADDGIAYAYLTSLHWALTQFTPASMEVSPTNVWERMYTIFILMMGLGAFSSFLASISSLMTQLRQLKAQQHREDLLIRRYLMEHGVSLELGNHILFFFRENRRFTKRQRLVEKDVKAFEQLPDSLRIKLHWEVYEPAIVPHPLFFHLSSQDASGLVEISHRAMNEKILGTGHELFHIGKTAESMYFVGKGTLEYVSNSGADGISHKKEIYEHHWLSEMVLWMTWIHRGTVTAQEVAELVELDSKKFHELVRHRHVCFEICRHYARLYVQRMAEACSGEGDEEEVPPDYWGEFDELQTIVHQTSEGLHKLQRTSAVSMLNLIRGVFSEKDGVGPSGLNRTQSLTRSFTVNHSSTVRSDAT